MPTIADVCDKTAMFLDGIMPCIEQALAENRWEVASAISEQLYSGLDGNEKELRPTYTGDPYFRQRYKDPQLAARKAEEYKDWKNEITPPEPSHDMGFRPRDVDTPNLFIDGTFHRSIVVDVANGRMNIYTYGFKEGPAIERKYGSKILKVSQTSWIWLLTEYVCPALGRLKDSVMR